MFRRITPSTTLDGLKKEAKRWLKALRAEVEEARLRFTRALPEAADRVDTATLRDVQQALARELGFPGWTALRTQLDPARAMALYEQVAEALVVAYAAPDEEAMRVVWRYFGHRRTWEVTRRYIRLALGKSETPAPIDSDILTLAEAHFLVARAQQFESWDALQTFVRSRSHGKSFAAKVIGLHKSGPANIAHQSRDWDETIALIAEHGYDGLSAQGQMTDELVARISALETIESLDLSSSRALTNEGLRHLPRLPRLKHLNLAGCAIDDSALHILRELSALESLSLAGTAITDAGASHLAACARLRAVDLSGTGTGDGAIRALAGKAQLSDFRSGNGLTDAGLALLHELPVFEQWQGGEPRMSLTGFDAKPNFLMLRGSFTNAGLAALVGLDGLFALNIDDRRLAVTGEGLVPLVQLPRLEWLAFDAKDESMAYIAALPRLRFLMCQDTSAGDDGFVALSKSNTLEYIWGRRCHNLRQRGFVALSQIPTLRALSVSCLNVDDVGLAALPAFPSLVELMPMDVPDEGYRHIGACTKLESLVLMYCRETTDRATEQITELPALAKYFASYTRISDRTPELLSSIASLEEIVFDSCAGLTDSGISSLARLPNLRELRVSGMPRVTSAITNAFEDRVRVSYSM